MMSLYSSENALFYFIEILFIMDFYFYWETMGQIFCGVKIEDKFVIYKLYLYIISKLNTLVVSFLRPFV